MRKAIMYTNNIKICILNTILKYINIKKITALHSIFLLSLSFEHFRKPKIFYKIK